MAGETPQWKFILANTNDLSEIGELYEARGKNVSLGLNKPGSASFTYPFSGLLAADLSVVDKAILAFRRGSSGVYALIWSGYITEISDDGNNETSTVSVVGWFERLNKRLAQQDVTYSSRYDNEIIFGSDMISPSGFCPSGFLRLANLTSSIAGYTIPSGMTIPVVAGSNPATPTLIGVGSHISSTTVIPSGAAAQQTITMKKDESFGEQIIKLTEQENGSDVYITPDTRLLNVYRKRGEDKRTDVMFGYNWGPENVSQFSVNINTSNFANYIVGRSTNLTPQSIQTDTVSLDKYGLFELTENLSADMKDVANLQGYIAAQYLFSSRPEYSRTLSITPYPFTIGSSVPEPFTNYDIGDLVSFNAKKAPRISELGGAFRVFGINVAINDDGNEVISELQIYAS